MKERIETIIKNLETKKRGLICETIKKHQSFFSLSETFKVDRCIEAIKEYREYVEGRINADSENSADWEAHYQDFVEMLERIDQQTNPFNDENFTVPALKNHNHQVTSYDIDNNKFDSASSGILIGAIVSVAICTIVTTPFSVLSAGAFIPIQMVLMAAAALIGALIGAAIGAGVGSFNENANCAYLEDLTVDNCSTLGIIKDAFNVTRFVSVNNPNAEEYNPA